MNDGYNRDDIYNESSEDINHINTTTFFQICLGLLSLSGCLQVFYVTCRDCYRDSFGKTNIIKRKIKDNELLLSECSICLDNYNIGDKISILSCNHIFHTKCLNEWLKKKEECPLCRIEL